MSLTKFLPRLSGLLLLAFVCPGALAGAAQAESAPVKLVLDTSGFIGAEMHEVNEYCPDNQPIECQSGNESGRPGAFYFPRDVASAPSGDIYVTDTGNERIQELNPAEPTGKQFVLMFGDDVNKKGGDVCTKAEEDECQTGTSGGAAGAMQVPEAVTAEPSTGDVYVLDFFNWRIDKYSADGEFLLMFGKDVNKNGGNVCTEAEATECQAGEEGSLESTEQASFDFQAGQGDLLTVGSTSGHEHVIFVGDAHRVQEFGPSGEWLGELRLPSAIINNDPGGRITSIATFGATQFIVYGKLPIVYEFDTVTNQETGKITVPAPGHEPKIQSIAIDSTGHLAVAVTSAILVGGEQSEQRQFGLLYESSDNRKLTSFIVPGEQILFGVNGIVFTPDGTLYAAVFNHQDIMRYGPVAVGEPVTLPIEPLTDCTLGPEHETDVTYDCKLKGEVDPWGVGGTEAGFQLGRTEGLGESTPLQPVVNLHNPPSEGEKELYTPLEFEIEHVRPNEPNSTTGWLRPTITCKRANCWKEKRARSPRRSRRRRWSAQAGHSSCARTLRTCSAN